MRWKFMIAAAAMVLAQNGLSQPNRVAERCDRTCLGQFITDYIAAMLARDPARLPLARTVRFTENGAAIPLGEGLWTGITEAAKYRFDYLDTASGQAASHISFVENGKAGLMSLRLRIVKGRITEIETVLNRGARNASNMVATEELWNVPEPQSTRLTRAQLAAGAESYLAAIAAGKGSLAPFDETTCVRLENGGVMATAANDRPQAPMPSTTTTDPWLKTVVATIGMGCSRQIDTGIYNFITSYNNARFPVIDVERQIVFGQWNFRRRGDVKGMTWNGKYVPFMESTQFPNENLLGQAFKFRNGKIVRVQGVFLNANVYKIGTGWGPGRDGPIAPPR
jgi:hypothetical protein